VAFVISEGQLAATDRPVAPAPFALTLSDGTAQDYATIWRTQHQVRTVVSFLARNIAQLAVHHYQRVSDTDRRRLADSPLAVLLGRPNPFTTRFRLFDTLVNDLGIYDVAYWAKVRGEDGAPGALVRLDPRKTHPTGDNPFVPDGFEVRGGKGKRVLPADQVVWFHGYNPENARSGCSPIEALRRTLLEEWQANQYREQLWRNGARMSGYISRPVDAPKWTDVAKGRFKLDWQGQYVGDGPNAGGTPILEDGMTFKSESVTPEQAEYLGARKLTREEVAAAYHVPLPMVGILEHATFSNIKEQHKQLYSDCLGPWLEMLTEELELQLLPEFDNTAGTYLEFNLQAKLAGSFEEQAAQLSSSVGAPWMTRNEARARQNLPQIDGGDELVTPLNVVVGGQASPADSVPEEPTTEFGRRPRTKADGPRLKADAEDDHVARSEKVLAAFFARQGKALASAVGAAKAARRRGKAEDVNELFDDERWNGELAADLYGLNTLIAAAAAHAALVELDLDEGEYDEDRTLAFLAANAERVAGAVNGATKRRLIDVLDESDDLVQTVKDLFAAYVSARAPQLARSHATSIAAFGTTEVARQTGRKSTKTWRVRSTNPRTSHARLNGETVDLDARFSNGAKWPGDSDLDEDERANCRCVIEIEFAD
jgi:HK97 family phage portal protein